MNAHFSVFILQQGEKDGYDVLVCGLWTDDRAHGKQIAGQGDAHVRDLIVLEFLKRWQDFICKSSHADLPAEPRQVLERASSHL